MEVTVEIPLIRRPNSLLVNEADRLSNEIRWTAGIITRPWGCGGFLPTDANYCDFEAADLDDFFDTGEWATFDPFEIYNTETCTSREADVVDLNGRLSTRWEVMVSEQIASRLNVEMAARATVFTTGPVNTSIMLANAEESLALSLHGGRGLIHMSPAALSMVSERLSFRDGSWQTASGHIVIADAGHTGLAPEGESSIPGTEWVYTSGQVVYGLSDARIPTSAVEYLDRSSNEVTARVIGASVVGFDPCSVTAIQYGYPDYTGSGS